MALKDSVMPKHRVLREVFRHYLEYRDLFKSTGQHVISHGYYVMTPELGELIKDKTWEEALRSFSEEELMSTGGVEKVPAMNVKGKQSVDEDGNPLFRLKPKIVSKETLTISLFDLQKGLKGISDRKREAFYYNVILDMKQKDVAAIMGITTVSVGQYVEQAVLQLSERYFAETDA
jgi:DNA-directed RNA polymerase specialized sigma24 family protein